MTGRRPVRLQHSDLVPPETLMREVHSYGFSVINDVLGAARCAALARWTEEEIERGPEARPFGAIVEREKRYDTPFRPTGLAREALSEACHHPVLGSLLRGLVTPEASLEELSALTSYPGAPDQRFHSRHAVPRRRRAFGLCLHRAGRHRGGHGGRSRSSGSRRAGRAAEEGARVGRMTVARGDAVVMDSTAAHRGSAKPLGR